MNIYLSTETNFDNNGLGFLTDVLSAIVIDELNGNYELVMEYVLKGNLSEYLKKENIIKCKVADGTYQLFRITSEKTTFTKIKISAKHIFYDLINNFLEDTYPKNKSGQTFLQHILDSTNFETNFTAFSDITSLKSARYVRINPVEAIMGDIDNSMVNLFGGELKRDNFTINFLSRVGENNGVKLLIGKNITGINISIDITEMATRVMPQGFDGLLLPELYVDSPLINSYPSPKIMKIEFDSIKYDPEDESAYHTLEEAYQALRDKVNEQYSLGLDKPKININVDWVELSKTNEYKQYANLETVRLGDTITAELLDITYQARIISTQYNVLQDRITNFQIGTLLPTIATQMNKIERKVEEVNPTSILDAARQNATSLITTALGGYIYKTQSELYIMDSPDPETAQKVWRWNINGLGYSNTGINGTYGIAMTMDGSIVADFITTGTLNTNVIQGYDSLTIQVGKNTGAIGDRTGKTSTITQDIASIEAQIGDIADITISASSDVGIIQDTEFQNIAESYPIRIEIHPIQENISYLYPNTALYPNSTTFLKIRQLKFTNTSTNESFYYTLPDDLLYYDEDNYDTFVADYETSLITITKNCGYNANGTVKLLDEPEITTYNFDTLGIELTEGNYRIELPSYTTGFLFVRLMALNAYTAQFATKVELNSAITQTATEINLEVSKKTDKNEIISTINQSAEQIGISADKVNIAGVITAINNNTTSTIDGDKITTGTITADKIQANAITTDKIDAGAITADKVSSDIITTTNFNAQNINASNITSGTLNVDRINAKSITADKIEDKGITNTKIADNTITNTQIANNTISSEKINNINADKITAGTINASNVTITNLNADNITAGTLNVNRIPNLSASKITSGTMSANRISGGSISGVSISIGSYFKVSSTGIAELTTSGGFMTMGTTSHPYVSALNVAYGSGGIVFRSGSGQSSAGYSRASIGMSSSNGNLVLDANNYVMCGGSGEGYQIATKSGGYPSTKNLKTNIITINYDDVFEDMKNINMYEYDYKYDGIKEKNNHDFGFIIDELENTKILSKYTLNYERYGKIENNKLIAYKKGVDDENFNPTKDGYDFKYKEWDRDTYFKLSLLMIKSLQNKIEKLEEQLCK